MTRHLASVTFATPRKGNQDDRDSHLTGAASSSEHRVSQGGIPSSGAVRPIVRGQFGSACPKAQLTMQMAGNIADELSLRSHNRSPLIVLPRTKHRPTERVAVSDQNLMSDGSGGVECDALFSSEQRPVGSNSRVSYSGMEKFVQAVIACRFATKRQQFPCDLFRCHPVTPRLVVIRSAAHPIASPAIRLRSATWRHPSTDSELCSRVDLKVRCYNLIPCQKAIALGLGRIAA